MAGKQKYIIEFDAETGKFTTVIDGLKDDLKGVSNEAKKTANAVGDSTGTITDTMGDLLGKFTGGLTDAFKSASRGVKQMFPALKGLKGAIIATGVGALIVLLGELIANFDVIKGFITGDLARADGLKKSNAQLDVMISKEQGITQILKAQGATRLQINKSKERSIALQLQLIENQIELAKLEGEEEEIQKALLDYEKLKNAERLLAVENEATLNGVLQKAKGILDEKFKKQTEIDKSNLEFVEQREIVENELNRLLKERQDKEENAAHRKIESGKLSKEMNAAIFKVEEEDAARIIVLTEAKGILEDAIAKNTQNNLDKQRGKVKDVKKEVDELKDLYKDKKEEIDLEPVLEKAKADALEAQISAAADEIAKVVFDAGATAIEREIMANEEKYNTLLSQADQYGIDRAELEEAREIEFDAITAKHAEIRSKAKKDTDKKIREDEIKLKDSRLEIAGEAIGAIKGLTEAFAKDGEKGAKQQFKVAKALGISEAIVNTSRAIMAQLSNPDPTAVITGRNFVQAGIAGALGIAQVAKIARSQFGGGSGGGGGVSVPSSSTPSAPQQTAPQVDFGFLQQGNNQNTIQAYVLAQNVTNSTQANQLVKDQAAL